MKDFTLPSTLGRWVTFLAFVVTAVSNRSFAVEDTSAESVVIVVPTGTDVTAAVEFRGLPPDVVSKLAALDASADRWSEVFPVHVARDNGPTLAILGKYAVMESSVTFSPRFPWVPGVGYEAEFRPALLDSSTSIRPAKQSFTIARPAGLATVVESIYPSGNDIPENQLKFYLHFSQPMSRGDSYRHLELLDHDGQTIADPFLELGEELWNSTGTRLTVLIDPGRIKRGLKPREEVGPVFEEGRAYKLVVRPTWQDATGRLLQKQFEKSYRVGPPDMEQPSIDRWSLDIPAANSRDPLVVTFEEPLDHAMLQHSLVIRREGSGIAGSVTVDKAETVWRFKPATPWPNGRYSIDARPTLEDLAGNSLGRPFEVQPSPGDAATSARVFRRQFVISEGP